MLLETKDLQPALLEAAKSMRDFRLFKRETTIGRVGRKNETVRVFGIRGHCDLWGVWRGGLHVEVELKSATGAMSDGQLEWQEECAEFGVKHIVLQALPQEPLEAVVKRWLSEIEATKPQSCDLQRMQDHFKPRY